MTGSSGHQYQLRTLIGKFGAGYVKMVHRTGSYTKEPKNLTQYSADLGPAIVVAWHGQNMILPPFWPYQQPLEILVSRHRDAEISATAYKRLGLTVIRGSGSAPGRARADKGGAGALRQMVRALNRGSSVALTADMPPGPARRAGRGTIMMAQLSGKPILPLAVTTRFRLLINNWCRFAINLPMSRGAIVLGDPIMVPRDADEALIEEKRLELEDSLNALTVRADFLVGRAADYGNGGPVPKLTIGYYFYWALTRLLSPLATQWLARRLEQGKEQHGRTSEKLGVTSLPRPPGTLLWLHATSIGEATSCLVLIEKLLAGRDDLEILLTTTTVTAAEVLAKRLPERSFHQYVPLDLPGAVHRFLDHWRPDLAVFAESEIWPNTIVTLYKRKIPIALVNGRMSKQSYKIWRKTPDFIRVLLARYDHISAQSLTAEIRLANLGARNTKCFGNMKADIPPVPVLKDRVQILVSQIGTRRFWLAASTHDGEEDLVLKCHKILRAEFPDLLTLIVPRHRERAAEISAHIKSQNLVMAQRSNGDPIKATTEIYLADTLGELNLFYALSAISFIGGSLAPVGGHNPIEAVDGNAAILHGPHVYNFQDIYQLLGRHSGAIAVGGSADLAEKVALLLNSEDKVADMLVNSKAEAATLKGASEKTAQALLALLDHRET